MPITNTTSLLLYISTLHTGIKSMGQVTNLIENIAACVWKVSNYLPFQADYHLQTGKISFLGWAPGQHCACACAPWCLRPRLLSHWRQLVILSRANLLARGHKPRLALVPLSASNSTSSSRHSPLYLLSYQRQSASACLQVVLYVSTATYFHCVTNGV